jgi:hypothetical protein
MLLFAISAFICCSDDSDTADNGGCASGTVECAGVCCPGDATQYACNPDGQTASDKCVLISCDTGFWLCGNGCIPASANCCNQDTGTFCQTGEACCGDGCMPIGSSCCGNGNYCPVGSVCCNGGTACC